MLVVIYVGPLSLPGLYPFLCDHSVHVSLACLPHLVRTRIPHQGFGGIHTKNQEFNFLRIASQLKSVVARQLTLYQQSELSTSITAQGFETMRGYPVYLQSPESCHLYCL